MADKYVDTDTEAQKLTSAGAVHGDKTVCYSKTFEVAVADNDGDIFRLMKNVPADLIPIKFEIATDTITDGTDWDLGFYKTTTGGVAGAVIDKDKLADGLDFSSATTFASPQDGLKALDLNEIEERIYTLAGDTLDDHEQGYDIALTANTVGSALGTISVRFWFRQG